MPEKVPMARMQLLLPPELKTEIEQFAEEQGMSANEAIRLLARRGLSASGKAAPVETLLEELGYRVRDMEQRLEKVGGLST
jgi:antitoxin component of RelBE/YafQ-DinJ toxin-antitoxin module